MRLIVIHDNDGSFLGNATRAPGLVGAGSAALDMPPDVDLSTLPGGTPTSRTIWLRLPPDVNLGPNEFAFYDRALMATEIATHAANVRNSGNYFVPEPNTLTLAAMAGLVPASRTRGRRSDPATSP